jgi:pyrroloquinoline quinone biosynthesis protein D
VIAMSSVPRVASHVRLRHDPARDQHVLLGPETVAVLNGTSADILLRCDGRRTVAEIVAELRERYDGVADHEVRAFLHRMAAKHYVEVTDG